MSADLKNIIFFFRKHMKNEDTANGEGRNCSNREDKMRESLKGGGIKNHLCTCRNQKKNWGLQLVFSSFD
jgi:hypothetical protein